MMYDFFCLKARHCFNTSSNLTWPVISASFHLSTNRYINQVFDLTKNTSPVRCFLDLMTQCPLSSRCLIHTALVQNKQLVRYSNFSVVVNGVPGFESLHVLGLLFCRTRTGFILSFLVNSFLQSTWKRSPLLNKQLHSKPRNLALSLIFWTARSWLILIIVCPLSSFKTSSQILHNSSISVKHLHIIHQI